MRINVAMSRGVLKVRLGDSLDLAAAETAREKLLQLVGSCERMEVDLSSLTGIDMAGIQILLALRKEVQASARSLRLLQPSAPVESVLRLLRMETFCEGVVASSQEVKG